MAGEGGAIPRDLFLSPHGIYVLCIVCFMQCLLDKGAAKFLLRECEMRGRDPEPSLVGTGSRFFI